MFSLRSRQYGDAETATLEKDLFLNFVVVILLLVGQQHVIAKVKTAGHGPQGVSERAESIFIRDGRIHFGSLSSPRITLDDIEKLLREQSVVGEPLPILIYHTADTPSGFVHEVLVAVGKIPEAEPLLALCKYTNGG
jgi:hypothetical protein